MVEIKGHADTRILRRYQGVIPDLMRDATSRLEGLLVDSTERLRSGMPFAEASDETYVAFGRLTVAFGRLEGTVNWLLSLLAMHKEGKGWVTPDAWNASLRTKLDDMKALARDCLPSDKLTEIRDFAGTVKVLARERRRVVHALVMHEITPPPLAVVTIFRTGLEGGASVESVPLAAVWRLAAEVHVAAERGLALTKEVADALKPEDEQP